MSKRPIDVILDQIIFIGGQFMTRRQLQSEMQAEEQDPRCIQFFVFGTEEIKPGHEYYDFLPVFQISQYS